MQNQKRVLGIHDISGVGKCSLTVVLPIISSCGVEVSVLPTAVLSTHTGGFQDFTYRDLTEDISPITKHWETLNIHFDGIYTGFLGSFEQIDLVSQTIDKLKSENTIIVVDPVMADNGELYSIFSSDFPNKMKTLCQKADILVPNITEACLLTETEYVQGPYSEDYIDDLLSKLSELGVPKIVLTGVFYDNENLGAITYDCQTSKRNFCYGEKIDGSFHGTGDVFASVLVGAMLNDKSLEISTQIAVDFTISCIKRTLQANTERKYGVNFENGIPWLVGRLELT